jgi:hypothetical protein
LNTAIPALSVRLALAAVLALGMLVSTGCKKPEDELGLSVLDPADTLSTVRIDTSGILTWPRVDDPVRTSVLSTNEVGSYVDDAFGPVLTGTATQLRLSVNNIGPADPELVCDSLVLSFAFSTTNPVYGDLDPQIIRVHKLSEDLSPDSLYKSDRQPMMDMADLVQGSPRLFTPSPTEGPEIGGETLVPQLRLPLDIALGQELLNQWGHPTMADNASFLAYFKGLVVVPDNAGQATLQGGVWRFNLLSGASKMTLYYHDGEDVPSQFDFIIGTGSARYTYGVFDHSAASLPGLPQALADTTQGQTTTYVQSLGGLRTEIRFPYLDRYADSPYRALAKAELIVPIAGDFHDTYLPPEQLFAFRKAEDGTDLLVPDQVAGQGAVGGFYDAQNREYRFNLTRWTQGVINGTYANTGLSLVPGSNGVSVNRAALAGPLNPDGPMQLVLTFTTY